MWARPNTHGVLLERRGGVIQDIFPQPRGRRGVVVPESAIIASRSPSVRRSGAYDMVRNGPRVACNPGHQLDGDAGFLKRIRTELRRFNTMEIRRGVRARSPGNTTKR